MKILLDECMPRKLKYALPEHECETAPEAGFANKKNGVCYRSPKSDGFELFLTMDKGIEHQQNLTGRTIAVLIVRAKSNRLKDLLPHMETCRSIIRSIKPGDLLRAGE